MKLTFLCILLCFVHSLVESNEKCMSSTRKRPLSPIIGLVSEKGARWVRTFQENLIGDATGQPCILPEYIPRLGEEELMIPFHGWTKIEEVIRKETEKGRFIDLIVGPYYASLAMVMDQQNVSYLVTDEKGHNWTDRSRTQDQIHWRTTIDLRPPAVEQNTAVVDLFILKKWNESIMVMPSSPADNYECQNLADQILSAGKSLVKYFINTNKRNMEQEIRNVLKNSLYQQTKPIIVCSPRDGRHKLINVFLKMAFLFNMFENEYLVFMFIDPSSNLTPFTGDNIYKLKLYAAKCQMYAFRYIKEAHSEMSIAKDLALVTREALLKYMPEHTQLIDHEKFIKALKSVEVMGDTGFIAFNSTGHRRNYTLHLYQYGGADTSIEKAEWKPGKPTAEERLKFKMINETKSSKKYGIFPDNMTVVVVLEEPFVMNDTDGKYSCYDLPYRGFTIDLLCSLSEKLYFRFNITISPGNKYGSAGKNDSWDGIIGEVISKRADIGMGAISINSKRNEVVDFSKGIMSTGINMLIKKPEETQHIFQFLESFSLELWLGIAGMFISVSILYILLDYPNQPRQFTVKGTLWFSIGTMVMRGTDFSPQRTSQRILTVGFTFFVLVIVSTYTANMAAFLTTPNLEKTVNSLEDLKESEWMSGTVNGSNTMNFLKDHYNDLFKKMEQSNRLVEKSHEGIYMSNKSKYAFVFDYLINSYAAMQYCGTMIVGTPVMLMEHGIVMRKGSLYKTSINIKLLQLQEEGVIKQLRTKWWTEKKKCGDKSTSRSGSQFDVKHTAGVFIITLTGLVCSLAFFLSKKLYLYSKTKHGDENITKK